MADYNKLWAGLLILVLFFISQQSSSTINTPTDSNVDLSNIVNPSFSFRGVRMYMEGTSLSTESVKIIEHNGDVTDLGYKSLNSGTLNVIPNAKYTLYFFMNDTDPSGTYYVDKQEVVGPVKDSVTPLSGLGCKIDKRVIFSSYNAGGQRQTADAYAISLTAGQTVDTTIRIKTYIDECFGSPSATKDNVVCFGYNANYIKLVQANTEMVSPPLGISNTAQGQSLSCYAFDVLKDGSEVILNVNIAAHASNEPTNAHNITVYADDINFDINSDTLEEIEGFDDEDGNNLGASVDTLGKIYIS